MSVLVAGICKNYAQKQVLKNISFQIDRGEIVGFLGENGAGKSTLMKIITGIEPPTKGNVTLFEKDVLRDRLKLQNLMGYLPESNPLYDWMYLLEYLYFIADLHQISHQKVGFYIEKLGLSNHCYTKISLLSKGYRQRVGIAATLLHNPDILLLDEPFVGLDPIQLKKITNFIKSLSKEKIVLFSSHILEQVACLCNRALVLKQGIITSDKKIAQDDKTSLLNYFDKY